MYDCFGCAADGNHAVYRIQLMGISTLPVVVLNVGDKAYGNSAFEMEAEANEEVDGYLDVRTPFEFFRYYGKI